jgi:hypothetical protein
MNCVGLNSFKNQTAVSQDSRIASSCIRELTFDEIDQVSGGIPIAPIVWGAVRLFGKSVVVGAGTATGAGMAVTAYNYFTDQS